MDDGAARRTHPRNGGRRSRRLTALVAAVGLLTAGLASGSPTGAPIAQAGAGAAELRVEAFNTNYVSIFNFPAGPVLITFDFLGDIPCDDFTLTGPNDGINPQDINPGCDLTQGIAVKASTDGGATFIAEITTTTAGITGFTETSVEVDSTAPSGGSTSTYGCGGDVVINAPGGALRYVPAAGPQSLDFSVPGPCPGPEDDGTYTITGGDEIHITQYVDDGETTNDSMFDPATVPNPFIRASVTANAINAGNFEPNSMVEVAVYTDATETTELLAPTMYPTDESGGFGVDLEFDLLPPHRVTASPTQLGGERVVDIVGPLSIDVDPDDDRVFGDRPDGPVHVSVINNPPLDGCEETADVAADGTMTWEYTSGCDIVDGTAVDVIVHDDDGDQISAEPGPPPRIEAFPTNEQIFGERWSGDATVRLTIADEPGGSAVFGPFDVTTDPTGSFNAQLIPEGFNFEAPMEITAVDGVTGKTKVLELVAPLTFELDTENNTLFGSRPDAEVFVEMHTPANGAAECSNSAHHPDDGTGVWGWDPDPCTVTDETTGHVSVADDDDDATAAGIPGTPVSSPVGPARLLDTRANGSTVDGKSEGGGPVGADTEVMVQVAGRAGIPEDATGAIINVTAVNPQGAGFVTVHACLDPRPLASSLNYTQNVNLGNEVVAQLDDDGKLCAYTSTGTELTIDVVASTTGATPLQSTTPGRFLDTRPEPRGETIDGMELGDGTTDPGETVTLPIAGRGEIPDDAATVVMNVTAVNPTDVGFVTTFPCTDDVPLASSLNYSPGASRGNEVFAGLDDGGNVCLFTSSSVDLTVDVVGYLPPNTAYQTLDTPVRFVDTREGAETIDGMNEGDGMLDAMERVEVQIGGRAGIPAGQAVSATLNLTAVGPQGAGFVTVFQCEDELPTASSLNYVAGVNGGNDIVAGVSGNDTICFYSSTATHLTVDVSAFSTV